MILVIIISLVLIVVITFLTIHWITLDRPKIRQRHVMEDFAREWNFAFTPQQIGLHRKFRSLDLFANLFRDEGDNFFSGSLNLSTFYVFDGTWTHPNIKKKTLRYRRVCVVEDSRLNLPHCFLMPKGLRQKAKILFGRMHRKIPFKADYNFAESYIVQGDDATAVEGLFDEATRHWFLNRKVMKYFLEANGRFFVLHFDKHTDDPSHLQKLFDDAIDLVQLWITNAPHS